MIEILCGGLVGALAGLLGFFIAKALVDPQKHPKGYQIILIVFVVAGMQLGNALVAPEVRAWQAQRDIERLFQDDPFYSAVLADHPELRGPLETAFTEALKNGNPTEAKQAGSAVLAPIVSEYLPRASDDALVGFARAMVATLSALQSDDPNRCYQSLHPGVDGPVYPTEDEGRSELMSAMAPVVESAQQDPREADSGDNVTAVLEGLQARLTERYGGAPDSLVAFSHGLRRGLVCPAWAVYL